MVRRARRVVGTGFGAAEEAFGVFKALAAIHAKPERFAQFGERVGAAGDGAPDLLFGDGPANTDIHAGIIGAKKRGGGGAAHRTPVSPRDGPLAETA